MNCIYVVRLHFSKLNLMSNSQNAEEGRQAQIASRSEIGVQEPIVKAHSRRWRVRCSWEFAADGSEKFYPTRNRSSWADWKLILAVEEGSGKESVKWLNLWQISSDCLHNKQLWVVLLLVNSNEMGGLPIPRWVESLFLGKLRQNI